MEKLTTVLWFDKGQAREAAEFYAATFPDSYVGRGGDLEGVARLLEDGFRSGLAGDCE